MEKFFLENAVQAKKKVEELVTQGYTHDDIYIFAHSEDREDKIADALDSEQVGMSEQGFLNAMKNMFTSRGDKLRSQMQAVGMTEAEAEEGESELDKGRLLLVAKR
ncbi:general stress protein [Sporosarcina sp. P37]|uniref:general stress protein n=1 Tax=unclassified Sporosarcina TaxID=2647733 RepID=UPI0009C03F36|nr:MULTISPECIES: general stress protein [unclassified Sporosarcina]ARD47212.1 general stress protein [Sporosarcina sp. P33]ARK23780.1 general stress protein [Sporosarcina sp. P37]PID18927.1 general stress protein [Sporosarcina sp. P35]